MSQTPDITAWAESDAGFYLAETKSPIILAPHQRDILRHCFTPDANGRLPYETIVYSCPKKSGKTTIAALVAEWFGLFIDAPTEIFLIANTLEQSVGRSFKDLKKAIRLNGILSPRLQVHHKDIEFDHGTVIQALSSDYAGAAGSRHSLTVWDELWAYTSESSQRLWDELTPVPTRQNSIRFVVTYAGFESESELLELLYKAGMQGDPVPELEHIKNGRGEPACRAAGRMFQYWDHELKEHPGLTVTPDEYHQEQRRQLRPVAFTRLHLNDWVSSLSQFVSAEQWAACYSALVKAWMPGAGQKMILGADASTSRDLTALVGAVRQRDGTVHVTYCRVWKPEKSELRAGKPTVDLSVTISAEIQRLHKAGAVASVVYDPYQLHSIALDLEKAGVKMIEMPQTAQRTQADQALYDAVIGKTIKHFNHPELNKHISNAVAIYTPRGFRLAKEKTRQKIDAAVALSMAHHGALETWTLAPAGELINDIDPAIYKTDRRTREKRKRKRILAQLPKSY